MVLKMNIRNSLIRLAHANTSIRPHLLPIITASSCLDLSGGAKSEYLESVWEMYQQTYRTIGMHISNPNRLLEYDVWNLCFGSSNTPVSFTMYEKTTYGFKATLSGHDGSSLGKAQAVNSLRTRFRLGVYGEVSHKVKDIVLAAGTPVICNAYVGEILGKQITPLSDGISYERTLAGIGKVTKVMVGEPRGVPTTNPHNPVCPIIENRVASALNDEPDLDIGAHLSCLIY